MKRGRKKDPANVAPGSQPKAVLANVKAPTHLNPEARAIFVRVAKILTEMNILTAGDIDVVASYAEVAALGQEYKAKVDENGATCVAKSGYVGFSGDYLVWRDCYKSGQKLLNDLGLTPASRTRVAAAVESVEDEFTAFIAKRGDRGNQATRG